MGIDVSLWRARIGSFSQPLKAKKNSLFICNLQSVFMLSLAVRVVLFSLLAVYGVETNPGPKGGTPKQTKGTNVENRTHTNDHNPSMSASTGLRNTRSSSLNTSNASNTYSTGASNRNQPHINTLFSGSAVSQVQSSQLSQSSQSTVVSANPTESPSNSELKEIMLSVKSSVSRMEKRFEDFETALNEVKNTNKMLCESNESIKSDINGINVKVADLEEKLKASEERRDRLEAQSRRDNLRFYGIEEHGKESWEETEAKVINYISNDLKLETDKIRIERAHRLPGSKKPRPIIAKFAFFKDKENVLKSYRLKVKELNDLNQATDNGPAAESSNRVRVSEDFTKAIMKARNELRPLLREALHNGKDAYMRYDKLHIDGKVYYYDECNDSIEEKEFHK